MILSDQSFERSHRGEHYALSFERSHRGKHYALCFEREMPWGYENNYDYRPIFDRLSQYFSKVFL